MQLSFLSKLPKHPSLSGTCTFTRFRSQLAPKNVKYVKRQKGVIPIPTGGSVKGTTLAFGEYGIRVKGNGGRLSADHLTVAEDVIKRKLKVVKGSKVYMRVFPSTPVSVKVSISICNTILAPARPINRVTKHVWEEERAPSSSGQCGKYFNFLLHSSSLLSL